MNNYEFIESDWKIYRELRSVWIENYMERLCKKYSDLLASDTSATDRIQELYDSLQKATRKTDIIVRDSRTYMKQNICYLLEEGVITLNDLEGFSHELQEWAASVMGQ
ncbi:MAG: multidrug transporter [Ruminiclostridium sp.]|nr:multidrug transporter [Ruminiclostridium sp.]